MSRPTVTCFDTGGHYVFWCTFCQRWHSHSRGDGHRVAHCHQQESPYSDGGYILRCIGKATSEILRDITRRHPKGLRFNQTNVARSNQDQQGRDTTEKN